jgi:hypothetical protein
MEPKFIQIGNVVIASAHIVRVALSDEAIAVMHLTDGADLVFEGDEATAVRKFFAAPEAQAPAA